MGRKGDSKKKRKAKAVSNLATTSAAGGVKAAMQPEKVTEVKTVVPKEKDKKKR